MALTATATQGFEKHRNVESDEVLLVPGVAGTTYDEGDLVTVTQATGLLALATANQVGVARVAKKTVVSAQTVAFPAPKGMGTDAVQWGDDSSINLSLVPVEPHCPVGTKLLRATFKDHKDDTVISYSASSRYIACTTGFTADNYPSGALLYVYQGKGAGQVNLVESYDHTGGTVELMLVVYRPFQVALDSTSKFIVLSGEAATTKGAHQLGLVGIADEDEIETDDSTNDGKYILYADWRSLPYFLSRLMLPVAGAHLFS